MTDRVVTVTLLGVLTAVLGVLLYQTGRRARAGRADLLEEVGRLRHEVTSLEHGRAELEKLSVTDPLTGVHNLRSLQLSLDWEIERAIRFGRPLAVMLLDTDRFADVNALHGHQRGNTILREFAQRMVWETRQVDTLGRYGGDEFLLILPETDAQGAATVAERLCYAVRRHPFGHGGPAPARLTVSVGIAVYPSHGNHASTLLRRADEALFQAKQAGRDCWRTAGDGAPDNPRR